MTAEQLNEIKKSLPVKKNGEYGKRALNILAENDWVSLRTDNTIWCDDPYRDRWHMVTSHVDTVPTHDLVNWTLEKLEYIVKGAE